MIFNTTSHDSAQHCNERPLGLNPREFSRGQILQLADWGGQFARRWDEAPPTRRFAPRPNRSAPMRAAIYSTPVAGAAE
jgi:hypothetical protein